MDLRSNLSTVTGAGVAVLFGALALVPLATPRAQGVAQQWPQMQQMQPQYPQQMPQHGYPQQQGYPQQVYPQQVYPQAQPQMQMQQPVQLPQMQQHMPMQQPAPVPQQAQQPTTLQPHAATTPAPHALQVERVEADVSTRSVAITSSFVGTEIVIFGSVDNSRQSTAEAGLYDIAIVIEGTPTPVVARRKSRVAGLWINTASQTFDDVPSYYAITSTRPIEEITDAGVLAANEIGFEYVNMASRAGDKAPSADELGDFKRAVVRRKQHDKLYQKSDYGVAFIGRILFRSAISLPANVPVGPLVTHVYLFKDGKLLGKHSSKVNLQREGIERYLHDFAFDYPMLYGIFAVVIAVLAGMIASALFKKGSH
jgi:uncharacterized protein (TIGR02186 family)